MRLIAFILIVLNCSSLQADPLIIGIPPQTPPFVMFADSKHQFCGFDIALMDEICKRIQQKCQYKPLNFDQVFAGVQDGSLDLGIGNITITPEREEQFLFSLPYLQSYARYITQKGNPIYATKDIKGKIVGMEREYLFKPLVLEQFGGGISIKTYPNAADLVMALTTGEVNVIIIDAALAESYYVNDNNLALVGAKMPLGFGYGIVATKNNNDLISTINRALLNMEMDGTYLSIYTDYFSLSDN